MLAIIGGSGLAQLAGLEVRRRQIVRTPYGEPSGPITFGMLGGAEVAFLARHGYGHTLAPHEINYRANLWALREKGATRIVAVCTVGGIAPEFAAGALAIPDQLIDYTWGRAHTYVEGDLTNVTHVDFTEPYCEALRQVLIAGGRRAGIDLVTEGTYGATQGPRLETAQEIRRLERDGCDLVGMTGMPEAALARELRLCYACCAVVVNWAAGKAAGPITMDAIEEHLAAGMEKARRVLANTVFD